MTVNINDFYQTESKWLKAGDLKKDGKPIKAELTIDRTELVEFKDNTKKLGVFFRGKEKGLVLNKTNASLIAEQHGQDTSEWPGKKIKIFATTTDFGGERVECIRVEQYVPEAFNDDDLPDF
jgi:hypothetical protein